MCNTDDESDDAYEPESKKLKKDGKTRPVDKNVCSNSDRNNISNRKLMSNTAARPDLDLNNTILSVSTIARDRKKNREEIAQKSLKSLHSAPALLTVHWDSKKMPSLIDKKKTFIE